MPLAVTRRAAAQRPRVAVAESRDRCPLACEDGAIGMKQVIRDIASGDERAMRRLVEAARVDALAAEDLAELAGTLAGSGALLGRNAHAADVASTGGPSSLSTLICPLHLRARGLTVPKIGVSGRPAGGVDVLQTVPGFRAALEPDRARDAVSRFGYVHLLADERWAPLDARLFAFRQREGAQDVPGLVVASILAKKLAAGAVGAGLEVRVAPHGNFGDDLREARLNAHRYSATARLLDMRPVCALTDATGPYQPYIGRGEALIGLADILAGSDEGWLGEHHRLCRRISDAVAVAMGLDVTQPCTPSALRDAHDDLLRAHGTSPAAFDERVRECRGAPRTVIRSDVAGVVEYDLGLLRDVLVARQRADEAPGDGSVPDPAGVILEAPTGTRVELDEALMSIRVPQGEHDLVGELAASVRVRTDLATAASSGSSLEVI